MPPEAYDEALQRLIAEGLKLEEADSTPSASSRPGSKPGSKAHKAELAAQTGQSDDSTKDETDEKDGAAQKTDASASPQQQQAEEEDSDVSAEDPIRFYLREMGLVELLTRDGEVAIAKRIVAGREKVMRGLWHLPFVIRTLAEWSDLMDLETEYPEERASSADQLQLRELIDLDVTYALHHGGREETPSPPPQRRGGQSL